MAYGPILLYGSGATTTPSSTLLRMYLGTLPERARIALVETPAGFQPNSSEIMHEVSDFLHTSMGEFISETVIIEARSLEDPDHSPNNTKIAEEVRDADVIYLGAGSPTYTVRQLRGTRLWEGIIRAWENGAMILCTSASTVAAGTHALPVYEIYKVGENLHWKPGLDLLSDMLPKTTFIAHWNNNDGGKELDTSRCYLGQARFEKLLNLLPQETQVIGIDEHTGIIIDLNLHTMFCWGKGSVYLIRNGKVTILHSDHAYDLSTYEVRSDFSFKQYFEPAVRTVVNNEYIMLTADDKELIRERNEARSRKDFVRADAIRDDLIKRGIPVSDTALD